jgi:hypothetical protein
MASLTTQQIAAADSSNGSSLELLPSVDQRTSFDGVTLTFHWVTVALVLGLFTTAIWHAQSHDDVLRVVLLRIHRSLGVTVWKRRYCDSSGERQMRNCPRFRTT